MVCTYKKADNTIMLKSSNSVTDGGDRTKAKSVQIYQCQQCFALNSYALHIFSYVFSHLPHGRNIIIMFLPTWS